MSFQPDQGICQGEFAPRPRPFSLARISLAAASGPAPCLILLSAARAGWSRSRLAVLNDRTETAARPSSGNDTLGLDVVDMADPSNAPLNNSVGRDGFLC